LGQFNVTIIISIQNKISRKLQRLKYDAISAAETTCLCACLSEARGQATYRQPHSPDEAEE